MSGERAQRRGGMFHPILTLSTAGAALLAFAGPAQADPDSGRAGRAPAPVVFAAMATKSTPVAPLQVLPASARPLPAAKPRGLAGPGQAEPYAGPPYQVEGRWFVPAHEPNYNEVGVASWYGPGFHGKATASGEVFDQDALTAAHPTLPIPSLVRVTHLDTGRTIVVRLNDRGPYKHDRIIDLSKGAAEALGVTKTGTAKVRVEYVGPAPAAPNSVPGDLTQTVAYQPPPAVAPVEPSRPVEIRSEPLPPMPAGSEVAPVPVALAAPLPKVERRDAQPEMASQPGAQISGALYLQAGAFADLANAHRQRDLVSGLAEARVESLQTAKGELYRVLLGPWTDVKDRDHVLTQLDAIGVRAIPARAG